MLFSSSGNINYLGLAAYASGVLVLDSRIEPDMKCWIWSTALGEGIREELTTAAEEEIWMLKDHNRNLCLIFWLTKFWSFASIAGKLSCRICQVKEDSPLEAEVKAADVGPVSPVFGLKDRGFGRDLSSIYLVCARWHTYAGKMEVSGKDADDE